MLAWFRTLPQDLLFSLRTLRKNPVFLTTTVVTLGLGLGLNTAFFAFMNAVLLKPLAVHDPETLVNIELRNKQGRWVAITERDFDALHKEARLFSDVLARTGLQTGLDEETASGEAVSTNYFAMLGARPSIGRLIQDSDTETVLVLSDWAWSTRFGGDPAIVGRKVRVGGFPFQVIGVARPEFAGLERTAGHFWIPLAARNRLPSRGQPFLDRGVSVTARLRPGVTARQAEAFVTAYARQATAERGENERAARAIAGSIGSGLSAEMLKMILPFLIAFGLTMVIPCANAANLLLARALARQREIGVRLALGASRGRIIRQLLTEGLIIALLAGLAGVLLSRVALTGAVSLFYATAPATIRTLSEVPYIGIDARVYGYMLVASVLTTAGFALLPALQSTRHNLSLALRGEFGSFRASRMRNAFVVSQVAMCLLLLVPATILLRKSSRMASMDSGYQMDGVLGVALAPGDPMVAVDRALEGLPWVESKAFASNPPAMMGRFRIPADGRRAAISMPYNLVSPEFFPLLRLPLVRGRNFTRAEAASDAALAIVSESAARQLWPGEQALGKQIRAENRMRPPSTVIGVTRDILIGNRVLEQPERSAVYFPALLNKRHTGIIPVLVRGKGDPQQVRRLLQGVLHETGASSVGARVMPLRETMEWETYAVTLLYWLSSILGGVALLLTVAGIYGATSYLLGQRTKEIGIRMAIGATAGDAARLLLSYSMRLAAVGAVVGIIAAAALAKVLAANFPDMNTVFATFDLAPYVASLAVILVAAILASLGPAWRASVVDPASVLRSD